MRLLGRMFNLLGEPIDDKARARSARAAGPFTVPRPSL